MKSKVGTITIFFIMLLCVVSYFVFPSVDTSDLENRTMMTFDMALFNPPAVDSIVYSDSVSERFETALKDQFPLRNSIVLRHAALSATMENIYTKISDDLRSFFGTIYHIEQDELSLQNANIELDFKKWPGYGLPRLVAFNKQDYRMTKIGSLYMLDESEYIFDGARTEPYDAEQVQAHANQINHIHDLFPNVKIYSYFVSQLNSTKWFDHQVEFDTPDCFEQIAQALPDYVKVKRLIYKDKDEYEQLFYKSDHHWNSYGALKGYADIYGMLSSDFQLSEMKKPVKEWDFSELFGIQYRGSRANVLKDLYDGYDHFVAYEFDLGERDVYFIDAKTELETPIKLGLWDEYKAGMIDTSRYYDHYISFYKTAHDQAGTYYTDEYFRIDNHTNTGHNMLLITDSTGRAIRDVLATHFDTTIYLDYRLMLSVKIDEIIKKYNIDTLVLNGLGDVWVGPEYVYRFTDGFGEDA